MPDNEGEKKCPDAASNCSVMTSKLNHEFFLPLTIPTNVYCQGFTEIATKNVKVL